MKTSTIKIEEMNWPDIKEAIQKGFKTVVIGVGSTEQHGPHLPTMTDALIGDTLANRVAIELGKALQAPTIRTGCSEHHLAFPGTISLRKETLKSIIHDYVSSLAKHGFENIIFIPSHGGNFNPLKEVIDEITYEYPKQKIIGFTDIFQLLDVFRSASAEYGVSKEQSGVHSGESETSIMLALIEDLVKKERFEPGYMGNYGEKERKILFEEGMTKLTKIGVLGDPSMATKEKGEVYLEKWVELLIKEIKKWL